MNIIFFAHPKFFAHQSMPRFTNMLVEGMKAKGHNISVWTASPIFIKLAFIPFFKKWLGYIDLYVVFPIIAKKRIQKCPYNTLFVFIDQALGIWIPLVSKKPHVVHCHDFLAQLSALGEIPQSKTSFTGKIYQQLIRNGYTKAKNFISVSKNTENDLLRFLVNKNIRSNVVYNGFSRKFNIGNVSKARCYITKKTSISLEDGYIMHIGGNQWYKNRIDVVNLYGEWRQAYKKNIPLLLIGQSPDNSLFQAYIKSAYKADIHFLTNMPDDLVTNIYQGATMLLYPSLAEGFGWPIAEAMACGCPVITTNEPPMTEVGANTAFYIEKRPLSEHNYSEWLNAGSEVIEKVNSLDGNARNKVIQNGRKMVEKFNTEEALKKIENIYSKILKEEIK